ncbi:MAG: hypothetical protein Q8M07_27500 [Prosthecobacter sp.]|nr:hypothetical protein [Prosthecobacter sp.]
MQTSKEQLTGEDAALLIRWFEVQSAVRLQPHARALARDGITDPAAVARWQAAVDRVFAELSVELECSISIMRHKRPQQ